MNCILKTSEVSQEPTSTSAIEVKMDQLSLAYSILV